MRTWIVRVVAVEAYLGNPADPLIWHFSVPADTADKALATMRAWPDFQSKRMMTIAVCR